MTEPRFPEMTVQLSGTDGNAFAAAALELATL
jgi:hypothetical protein